MRKKYSVGNEGEVGGGAWHIAEASGMTSGH